jgi:hypothetical protein
MGLRFHINQAKYGNLSVKYITHDFLPQKGMTKTDYQESKNHHPPILQRIFSACQSELKNALV